MTKLVVTVVLSVLILGAALYAFGGKIIPATANAGRTTSDNINNAFQ